MSGEPPGRDSGGGWSRGNEIDRLWEQINRMWADLKADASGRSAGHTTEINNLKKHVDDQIKELRDSKADKWVQTALAGAVTAVVMAVLMALLALVVVGGKPGKSAMAPVAPLSGP